MHNQNATRRLSFIVSGLEIITTSSRETGEDRPAPAEILNLKPEKGRRDATTDAKQSENFYLD